MLLILAVVLILFWAGGLAFHVAGFFIHILIVLAIISIVFHFLRGARA